ncbi:ABC-type oligopeptide transport system, permease component [Deinococcus geothermalis DSM 11300]|uniref:ABC-type oligopeptide transport system, permease component n=1 Tax=Deinococcus geothermalis (strain DSM 11300 / CIP 105573 / AG-3a) TaxID=319795 RepID=Q1IYP6_DEIGD|nr:MULTISPECIES: ABC transporter permease [Deinococcus]ABF45638.1 ABC-type oligopeptide transport system, permease component [Deinococcus geothermalis DSM 11300]MBI0445596.1 ABC transporter permease [Deinococcus sp. DB0503]TDE85951.1 ABC transporter permease [Deinococcus sp. S9]
MIPFLLRRLLQLIPVFLLSTVLVFFIIQAAPGDFASTLRGNPAIKPETVAQVIRRYHLDQPVYVQYFAWLGNFLRGDLGVAFTENRPVWEVLAPRIGNSLILVGLSTLLTYLIAIPVGVYGAVRPYSLGDRLISFVTYFGLGIPSFFFMMLVMFLMVTLKQKFGWDVPISGKSSSTLGDVPQWRYILDVLIYALPPSFVIALRSISSESRLLRGQMLEVLNQDYIRTSRAKGLTQNRTVYKHAFRNAVLPLVAGLGGLLTGLISGAGFVEVTYGYPGLTPRLLEALSTQDLYLLVSTTSLTVVLYVIGNLISDVLLAAVDPRIRYS